MSDVIDLLLRDAASRPSTWDAKAGTVEAVIASNAPVTRRDAKGPFNEVLDVRGADLSQLVGASVLDGHDAGGVRSVIGVVKAGHVEGNELIATLQMSSRPELEAVRQDIADGVIRHLSVGYSVEQWTDSTENGMRTRTAVRWTPKECSFVAIPADRNAHTRTRATSMTDITVSDLKTIRRTIRDLAKRSGCDTALADDLIDREVTVEEARAAILDDILKRGSVRISSATSHQSFDDPEFFREAVVDGLFTRIDPKHKPSEQGRQFAHFSLVDVARTVLQRAGINTTGLGADAIITRSFGVGGYNTTSDYPSIVLNVLDKSLRVAYQAAESGIKQVARQTTNIDFRAKYRVMLDSTGIQLQLVTEDGEFKRASMVDMNESYSLSTYGDIIALSRQLLINDDMNALGDVSRRLGIAAAQFEAQQLVNLLTANSGAGPTLNEDGLAMFCAGHNNYVGVGSGAVPSVTTLSAMRLAMRHQTGVGGGIIHVEPSVLVVPAELETTGEQLIAQIKPIQVADVNPFSALTKLVVEPRLPAYAWYLAAEPGMCDGIEYAYLASAPGPQLESQLGFQVDGLMVRIRLDWACGAVDFRSWQYNAGR